MSHFLYRKIDLTAIRPYIVLALVAVISITLVWAPFIFRIGPKNSNVNKQGFELIYRMSDGPLYTIAAQTLYRSDLIYKLKTFEPTYFAVHPPGFPLLIRLVSPINGYMNGMLLINFVGTIFLGWALYYLFYNVLSLKEPVYLTILSLLTPRMLISSSVGSSEVVFMLCSTLAIILIFKKRYLFAGLFAMFASFTRIPGVLLGIALGIYIISDYKNLKKNIRLFVPMIFSFLGLLAICIFYQRQYGDFFAYFHSSAVVPTGIIYSQFFINAKLVGDRYIEDILFYFGIAWVTLLGKSRELPLLITIYSWVTFAFVITISHREMSRYILPLIPFLIAMQNEWLRKTYVKISLLLLLPAIYLYVVNFIANYSYPLPINLLK